MITESIAREYKTYAPVVRYTTQWRRLYWVRQTATTAALSDRVVELLSPNWDEWDYAAGAFVKSWDQ